MATGRFVALLRGVNVGGNNRVGMADLRQVFMGDGYAKVVRSLAQIRLATAPERGSYPAGHALASLLGRSRS